MGFELRGDDRMTGLVELLLQLPLLIGVIFTIISILNLYLAVLGVRLYDQGYKRFFELETIQLHPRFRNMAHQTVPLRNHIILRIFIGLGIGLLGILILTLTPNSGIYLFYEFICGSFLLISLTNLLRHIDSDLTLYFVKQNPHMCEGHIKLSTQYSLRRAQVEMSIFVVIWGISFILVNRVFFLGGSLVLLIRIFPTTRWR